MRPRRQGNRQVKSGSNKKVVRKRPIGEIPTPARIAAEEESERLCQNAMEKFEFLGDAPEADVALTNFSGLLRGVAKATATYRNPRVADVMFGQVLEMGHTNIAELNAALVKNGKPSLNHSEIKALFKKFVELFRGQGVTMGQIRSEVDAKARNFGKKWAELFGPE